MHNDQMPIARSLDIRLNNIVTPMLFFFYCMRVFSGASPAAVRFAILGMRLYFS
jgi:hypothetical protein